MGKKITGKQDNLTHEQRKKKLEKQFKSELESEFSIEYCFRNFIYDKTTAGKSPQTIAAYKNYYNKLCKFLDKAHHVTPDDMPIDYFEKMGDVFQNSFMIIMHAEKLSIQTINFYLRGHRAFGNYCVKKGFIEHFECPITEKQPPVKQVYTLDEKQALREKPNYPIEENFLNWRTYCIIGLILNIGIRSNSILNIKIGDVDLDNGDIYINVSKTGKVERQGLLPIIIEDLTEWITFLKSKGLTDEDYLFCNDEGNKLSRSGLTKALRTYNERKGVDKTSIHLLRHTFTKDMIQDGADIFALQKALMHSDMAMVQRYSNIYADDVKKEVLQHSSLSQLERKKAESTKSLIRGKKK